MNKLSIKIKKWKKKNKRQVSRIKGIIKKGAENNDKLKKYIPNRVVQEIIKQYDNI